MDDLLRYAPLLWEGFLTTLLVTAGAAVIMILTSFIFGIIATSSYSWLRWPVRIIVEFFRGTSCYVQLFWAYFALPLFGVYIDALLVGILVIGMNIGCYGSEVVRGAIIAVSRDQIEGAIALNLSRFHTLRHVILPQAVVTMIPPLGNLSIEMLKITPLVSLITIADLTFQAQVIRQQTSDTLAAYGIILVVYFLLSSAIAGIATLIERHFTHGRDVVAGSKS